MRKQFIQIIGLVLLMSACVQEARKITVVVTNELAFDRADEVVKVTSDMISLEEGQMLDKFGIIDQSGQLQLIQYIDENRNGSFDAILFQANVPAEKSVEYSLKEANENEQNMKSELVCFSRFVPERTDDYAWENDRVAFRMFGPTAQKMFEESTLGGTLSSGIDCWLKKVEYPIIDKWYAEHVIEPGAYHIDTGEGLDNFHVGVSRGCGGLAVKSNDQYFFSKNYISYNTLTNGYLRTAFELDFAPWEIGEGKTINTLKIISLDKGSQLSKIVVKVEGTDSITAGLTLHENDGKVTVDSLGGWISYWQPHAKEDQLATAIVAAPGTFVGYEKVVTDIKDQSNVYVHLAVAENQVTYYTGFTWDKSSQFEDQAAWHDYLNSFAKQLKSPLLLRIEK